MTGSTAIRQASRDAGLTSGATYPASVAATIVIIPVSMMPLSQRHCRAVSCRTVAKPVSTF